MKLLSYTDSDEYTAYDKHVDVSGLSKEEIIEKVRKIKESYKNQPFLGGYSSCSRFEIMEVFNALELINLVGFEEALSLSTKLKEALCSFDI